MCTKGIWKSVNERLLAREAVVERTVSFNGTHAGIAILFILVYTLGIQVWEQLAHLLRRAHNGCSCRGWLSRQREKVHQLIIAA